MDQNGQNQDISYIVDRDYSQDLLNAAAALKSIK